MTASRWGALFATCLSSLLLAPGMIRAAELDAHTYTLPNGKSQLTINVPAGWRSLEPEGVKFRFGHPAIGDEEGESYDAVLSGTFTLGLTDQDSLTSVWSQFAEGFRESGHRLSSSRTGSVAGYDAVVSEWSLKLDNGDRWFAYSAFLLTPECSVALYYTCPPTDTRRWMPLFKTLMQTARYSSDGTVEQLPVVSSGITSQTICQAIDTLLADGVLKSQQFTRQHLQGRPSEDDTLIRKWDALLESASLADKAVLETFRQQIGQTVVISLGSAKKNLTIESVDAVQVLAMNNVVIGNGTAGVQVAFTVKDLNIEERFARMKTVQGDGAMLTKGLLFLKVGSPEDAKGFFRQVQAPFGQLLTASIVEHQQQAAELKREADEKRERLRIAAEQTPSHKRQTSIGAAEAGNIPCPQCRATGVYNSGNMPSAIPGKTVQMQMKCPTCKGTGLATQSQIDFYYASKQWLRRNTVNTY